MTTFISHNAMTDLCWQNHMCSVPTRARWSAVSQACVAVTDGLTSCISFGLFKALSKTPLKTLAKNLHKHMAVVAAYAPVCSAVAIRVRNMIT